MLFSELNFQPRIYKISLKLKGPFEPNFGQIAKKGLLLRTPSLISEIIISLVLMEKASILI